MIKTIIFDLSEVLISGLLGTEKYLAPQLGIPESEILSEFGGERLVSLCCGEISEENYWDEIIHTQRWGITVDQAKELVRKNFQNCVPGMVDLVDILAEDYELVLLSDHAVEWIKFILGIHPFLRKFHRSIFSYDLKKTKESADTFIRVLEIIGRKAEECLVIDDNPLNVTNARSVGIAGICFTSREALIAEMVSLGIIVNQAPKSSIPCS